MTFHVFRKSLQNQNDLETAKHDCPTVLPPTVEHERFYINRAAAANPSRSHSETLLPSAVLSPL